MNIGVALIASAPAPAGRAPIPSKSRCRKSNRVSSDSASASETGVVVGEGGASSGAVLAFLTIFDDSLLLAA